MSNMMSPAAISTEGVRPTKQRVVLAGILLFTLLVAYLDRVNVGVLLADNAFLTDLGIKGDPVRMGMLMTFFYMAYGLSNMFLSPLGDYLGPRIAMSVAILLWAISSFLGGLAGTFMLLLGARVILGLGEGMHWPMQSKYVKNWFPTHERGKANSAWLVGLMMGPAIAMPLFTGLISIIGWHNSFFFLALLGLLPLVILWFWTTDHPHQNKRVNKAELDYIQASLKIEAEAEAKIERSSVWENIKTVIFNYRFWLVTVFYSCLSTIFVGVLSWLPAYLKAARGFSWTEMGAWSALPYLLGMGCIVVAGWLSDKVGRRAPFNAFSMLGAAAGIYFGAYATDNTTAAILISIGVASIGIGLPCAWSLIQQIVPGKAMGAGAGIVNGVGSVISGLAPVLIGYFIGLTGSYVGGLMYLVGAGLLGAACMAILTVQKY